MDPNRPKNAADFSLTSCRIQGFRGLKDATFALGRVNLVVGINGSGKTSVLQAISLLLERLAKGIVRSNEGERRIDPLDSYDGQRVEVECGLSIPPFKLVHRWDRRGEYLMSIASHNPPGLSAPSDLLAAFGLIRGHAAQMAIPVLAMYPSERATPELPSLTGEDLDYPASAGYDHAFSASRDFTSFFQWFKLQEDLENQRIREQGDTGFRDKLLNAVRTAIESAMEGYTDLRVQRKPQPVMVLKKEGKELTFQQLSGGERALVALLGDLARRMAILNPQSENPLEGPGCVLIDEVDLHLHPQWQRSLTSTLSRVFPNVQFILATHSPIVCGSVEAEHLLILKEGSVSTAEVYGWSMNAILRDVFEMSERPDPIQNDINKLDEALDRANALDAHDALDRLEEHLPPDDPEIVRANVILPLLTGEEVSRADDQKV